jgi:phosphate transport system permease protein
MLVLLGLCALIAIIPLVAVFFHTVREGLPSLSLAFFTEAPVPIGDPGGGMGNCILGSLILIALASAVAVPIGIFGGVYLSEYGTGVIAGLFRWIVDLLSSLPSIVVGLYVYAVVVVPMKSFSAHAGGIALAILMTPIVIKTTEEVLKLMPQHVREAGLALGLSRWRVIIYVVLKGRIPAVTTGVVLALARIAGETAPLLVTSFGNRNWPRSLSEPTASLPVQIYNYAISPYNEWHHHAWAGALSLVALIFVINLAARSLTRRDASQRGF